jgi:hypothetical protein
MASLDIGALACAKAAVPPIRKATASAAFANFFMGLLRFVVDESKPVTPAYFEASATRARVRKTKASSTLPHERRTGFTCATGVCQEPPNQL